VDLQNLAEHGTSLCIASQSIARANNEIKKSESRSEKSQGTKERVTEREEGLPCVGIVFVGRCDVKCVGDTLRTRTDAA
jgi:hypothetical protein